MAQYELLENSLSENYAPCTKNTRRAKETVTSTKPVRETGFLNQSEANAIPVYL